MYVASNVTTAIGVGCWSWCGYRGKAEMRRGRGSKDQLSIRYVPLYPLAILVHNLGNSRGEEILQGLKTRGMYVPKPAKYLRTRKG